MTMFKKLLFLLTLALAPAFSQGVSSCYSGAQVVVGCTPLTDDAYWASKDPKVAAVHTLDFAARIGAAQVLDTQGFIIDNLIDIYGWSPTLVMQARGAYGYAWVPSAFQPNLVDPLGTGVVLQGQTPTDMSKPWPRSIRVSTDSKDYPSLTPSKPAPLPSDGVTWYYDSVNGVYGVVQAAVVDSQGKWLYTEGQALLYKGQTVYFHLAYSIMGTFPQFYTKKVQ